MAHVRFRNGVCLADDGNHRCLALELAQDIEIQVFVKASKNGIASLDEI